MNGRESLIEKHVCEHGETSTWWWDVLTGKGQHVGGWSGPLSRCGCCGAEFGFLESGWATGDRSGGMRWQPRDRCGACGGGLVKWGDEV